MLCSNIADLSDVTNPAMLCGGEVGFFEVAAVTLLKWSIMGGNVVTPSEHSGFIGEVELNESPYIPPHTSDQSTTTRKPHRTFRGPLLYFAVAGLLGAVCAMPLLAPTSIYTNPNPIGYLVILLSLPIGGVVYRVRSRNWPIDTTVRRRQWRACLATLLLPIAIAMMTGMRAQGFHMTILGGIVSVAVMFAILISGQRRARNMA